VKAPRGRIDSVVQKQRTAMMLSSLACNEQAETAALCLLLEREEGLEDILAVVRRDACPIVLKKDWTCNGFAPVT
jgi:hypothetical protein